MPPTSGTIARGFGRWPPPHRSHSRPPPRFVETLNRYMKPVVEMTMSRVEMAGVWRGQSGKRPSSKSGKTLQPNAAILKRLHDAAIDDILVGPSTAFQDERGVGRGTPPF